MLKGLRIGLIVAICVVLLSGCGREVNSIPVGVAAVRVDMFSTGYATVGVVKPETQVEVVAKYSGTVAQTFKEVGDQVFTGDPLLQLDTTPIMNQIKSSEAALGQTNAAVAQASAGLENARIGLTATESGSTQQTLLQGQTALENARITYDSTELVLQQTQKDCDNAKILFDAGVISKSALDTAQLALDKAGAAAAAAQTTLDAAQKNLDLYTQVIAEQSVASAQTTVKTAEAGVNSAEAAVHTGQTSLDILKDQVADYTVTSPIDGVIINKNAIAGGMIGQSSTYSVANIDQVIISTAVPKEEINKLSLGGSVQVFYPDNSSVETQITAISNSANAANLYLVQVTVENKEHHLKPGMNAKIVFVESKSRSIIAPSNSVVSDGKDKYIFMVENDTAKKVFVTVLGGNSDEIFIEPIAVDLSESTQIVTTNANLLKDGDPIKY